MKRILAFLTLVLAFGSVGCSRYVAVEGLVTLDGKPIDGATIVFLPEGGSKKDGPQHASAKADPKGKFSLQSHKHRGAIPGRYRVTVSKKAVPAGTKAPANMAEMAAIGRQMRETVPAIYTKEKTSPLVIDIPPGGNKEVRLELSEQKQ